ncbi:hypothetical protein [Polycladidibacter stylochi]|uniref:hypothetical protein n=1 Tax=Polycladidibacter stylochi TaxID=1807766 RepID=UPI000834DCD7|nr:hypothetical protein [Pseudovibrio stylochi]
MPTEKTKQKVLNHFINVMGEVNYTEIQFSDIAQRCEMSLAEVHTCYRSRDELLSAFLHKVDQEVLANIDSDMAEEPARERLFDVLMTRLDIMEKYRKAFANICREARCEPFLACRLMSLQSSSMFWMMAGAGIEVSGFRRQAMARALMVGFNRVVRQWLKEEDGNNAKSMAEMDRMLREGGVWLSRADKLEKQIGPLAKRVDCFVRQSPLAAFKRCRRSRTA